MDWEDPSVQEFQRLNHLIIDYRDRLRDRDGSAYMAVMLEITKANDMGKINLHQMAALQEKVRGRWNGE